MKVLSVIFTVAGIICLIVAALLGSSGFSDFQSDQELPRYAAEVVALRTEDGYVRPVVRYQFRGTEYQIIVENQDLYQGQKLHVILRDDKFSNAEIYRASPFQYGKVIGSCIVGGFGIVFLLVSFLLLRFKKRMESNDPLRIITPLFIGIGVAALCGVLALNIITYLPQNRDNEADYIQTSAVLVMVPEYSTKTRYDAQHEQWKTETTYYGDTVAQYEVNGKRYRAKVSDSKDNYTEQKITLFVKRDDPGFVREALNDTTLQTVMTIAFTALGIIFIAFGILFKRPR